MRLYTFVNFYLSPIQRGIQSAHLVHELFTKYANGRSPEREALYEWARYHKTMIVLNGGNLDSLKSIHDTLLGLRVALRFPFTCFNEDEASLGGIMTCVGVVVPEMYYDTKAFTNFDGSSGFACASNEDLFFPDGSPECRLINLIKSFNLA